MNHRFGRPTIKQIILYTLLMVAALVVVGLYMAGGNEVFDGGSKEPKYTYEDTVTLPMHSVRTLNPAAAVSRSSSRTRPGRTASLLSATTSSFRSRCTAWRAPAAITRI